MYVSNDQTSCTLIAPKESLDFLSQDECTIQGSITALEAYKQMTQNPPVWLRLAFQMRDSISQLAGVKKIGGFSDSKNTLSVQKGDKLDFFDVVDITDNALILTAIDKHLGVMICLQAQALDKNTKVTVTASVKTKNAFGTLYMLPVRPAHRFIVRGQLKTLKRINHS